MTTPRDGGAPAGDPQQPTDPTPAQPSGPQPTMNQAPMHQPPAFPSVGGDPDSQTRVDYQPAFARFGEPATTPSPQIPVAQTGPAVSTGGDGRWRWVAAGLATVLLVAVVVGAFFFLGATRPGTPSLVAQYVPANPAAYLEMRLDLPGDQRDRIASFMSNFPGFADQASFERKIDESLANALQQSGTGLDWEADVKPWFGGMAGLAVTSVDPGSDLEPTGVVVLSVKDRQKLDELIAARGGGLETEDYKGSTIYSGASMGNGEPFSFAATEDAFLAGAQVEDVKAALDAHAGDAQGLADDSFFTTQLAELSGDHLGLFYYDYGEAVEEMPMPSGLPGGLPGMLPDNCMADVASAEGVKLLGAVRAESDHMTLQVRAQPPQKEGFPQFPNRATTLAQSMPADTVAYIETRATGQSLKYYVRQLLECLPSDGSGPSADQLRQMLGTAPEDYFDFLEDVGFGVTLRDGKFGGGLIATVNDEAVAQVRLERILSALRLAAGVGGGEITIDEQQHGDATITVINLGEELVPGTEIPSLAISVVGGRLYMGVDDFVTRALDQGEADSLASAPRLQSALSATASENAAVMYVDIAALRGFIEGMVPSDERSYFDAEVKPFVEPITQLVMVGRNDDGIYSSNVFLYVE